ncbi:hypothetical protein DI272_02030 [Streptomyces sp. Act143]|nr:hypothetical protein DI272_02030 [Streptomyces sp. Act143]
MTVRRAVPLQGTAQDPGAALTPGGGGRGGTGTASTAAAPAAAPDASAAAEPAAVPAPPPNPRSEPARTDNESAAGAGSKGAEPTAAVREEEAPRPSAPSAEPGAAVPALAPGAAVPSSAPGVAATESGPDVVAAGSGNGGTGAAAVGEAHGGPKKPMLAAAAIVGAILIGVPFLVAGQGDKDDRGAERTDNAAGTVLDTDQVPHASESYATESPTPAASTSASPSSSKSPEEKQAKDTHRAPVVKPQQATPTAGVSEKAEQKKATTVSATEKLRRQANAASSARSILVRNATTGLCADVPAFGNGKVDGPVNQYPCNGTAADNQLWNLEVAEAEGGPQGASLFLIRNSKDKFCMDLPYYGSAATGTNVTEYYCRATADNQLWWLDPRSDGSYWIRSYSSNNLCLGLEGGASAGNDAHLEIGGCGPADRWTI